MTRSTFRALVRFPFAAALVVLAVAVPGCIDQAEGDRCSTLTGTESDCEVGLRCTPAAELSLTSGANGDGRCCPADRTQSVTDVCRLGVAPAGADASIPSDNPVGADAGTASDSQASTDSASSDSATTDSTTSDANATDSSDSAADASSDATSG